MIAVNKAADFFLLSHKEGLSLSRLQKLVYYADAWYMVNNEGSPLIEEDFEAWILGPTIRVLHDRFKSFQWSVIPVSELKKPELPKDVEAHLVSVCKSFSGFSQHELEQMVHSEHPWIEARGNCASDEPCENLINKNTMFEFYKKIVEH